MRGMKDASFLLAVPLSLLAVASSAAPGETPSPAGHVMVSPEALIWQSRTPGLAIAVAEGDPAKPGPFTMMLRLSDGAWIPPHWHNVDKRLVVIRGEMRMGMGETIDPASTHRLAAGGVAVVPAGSRHYEGGAGDTLVALFATGPFTTTFVESPKP